MLAALVLAAALRPHAQAPPVAPFSLQAWLEKDGDVVMPRGRSAIAALGDGCVRSEVLGGMRSGEKLGQHPHENHHQYYDKDHRLWVDVIVGGEGEPESDAMEGVLLSSVRLCSKGCRLPERITKTSLLGIELGQREQAIVEGLGKPLSDGQASLGRRTLRKRSWPVSARWDDRMVDVYVLRNRVVAVALYVTE